MKVLLLACLIASVAAFKYNTEWELWKRSHSKDYAKAEELHRHAIWESNKLYVENHNANASLWGYTLGMNEYADLDGAEFAGMMNGYRGGNHGKNPVYVPSGEAPATAVDWRSKGYVTAVKNQGQCGSCWAFSTTGSLEGQHFKASGDQKSLVSLSEQNLMDCSTGEGNNGCQGGLMDNAFKYIISNGGIDTEASYPYTAENGKCHFRASDVGATMTSFKDIPKEDCNALESAVGSVGPISVAMDASHLSFQLYHSGVYDPFLCSKTKLDHGVLIVGYDTSEDSWLVKNSWGTTWGMKGYFKITRKSDKCGLCTSASYPIV